MHINTKLSLNRSRSSAMVGLDIQPGYIAAVQARVNGSIQVQRAAGTPLPADTMREGEVLNMEALSDALSELFQRSQLDRRVRLGVANQRTVLRMLELPPVTDRKELAAAVRFQAEDQVPMPLSNAVLDFQSLGVVETAGGPRQRVVLVAAQRDMVERLLAAVREAGLRPAGVDLSAFALIRSLYRPEHSAEGRVLYLNVGGLTNMAIAEGTTCQFTRVVSGGLEAMATEVAERRQMSLDQAREVLRSTSLSPGVSPAHEAAYASEPAYEQTQEPIAEIQEPVSEVHQQQLHEVQDVGLGRPVEPAEWTPHTDAPLADASGQATYQPYQPPVSEVADPVPAPAYVQPTAPSVPASDDLADVRMILANGIREIAGEVRNSLDFHRSQDGGGKVSTVVLSGAALEIDGFAEVLQGDLGIPVRCETVGSVSHESVAGISPQRLAIAAGLAAEAVHS